MFPSVCVCVCVPQLSIVPPRGWGRATYFVRLNLQMYSGAYCADNCREE